NYLSIHFRSQHRGTGVGSYWDTLNSIELCRIVDVNAVEFPDVSRVDVSGRTAYQCFGIERHNQPAVFGEHIDKLTVVFRAEVRKVQFPIGVNDSFTSFDTGDFGLST